MYTYCMLLQVVSTVTALSLRVKQILFTRDCSRLQIKAGSRLMKVLPDAGRDSLADCIQSEKEMDRGNLPVDPSNTATFIVRNPDVGNTQSSCKACTKLLTDAACCSTRCPHVLRADISGMGASPKKGSLFFFLRRWQYPRQYIVSNATMISEWVGKDVDRSGRGLFEELWRNSTKGAEERTGCVLAEIRNTNQNKYGLRQLALLMTDDYDDSLHKWLNSVLWNPKCARGWVSILIYLQQNGRKWREMVDNCIMKSFTICTSRQILLGWTNWDGWVCSKHGSEQKCIQRSGYKICGNKRWYGKIILELILKKYGMCVCVCGLD